MALVFAPETRESILGLSSARAASRKRLSRRKRVDMRAGCRTWLVRSVGAIARVVVDTVEANLDVRVGDTRELGLRAVVGGN